MDALVQRIFSSLGHGCLRGHRSNDIYASGRLRVRDSRPGKDSPQKIVRHAYLQVAAFGRAALKSSTVGKWIGITVHFCLQYKPKRWKPNSLNP